MRFENVLQIYWTKGFFFGGNVLTFNQSLADLILDLYGFSRFFFKSIILRFELTFIKFKPTVMYDEYKESSNKGIIKPFNVILSQISSVNHYLGDLKRLNIIKLFLIKSHKGRSHALGKPVRGQRTWSNSWNSYNVNKTLRFFISETSAQLKMQTRPEKINYKTVKKKYAPKKSNNKKDKKPKQSMFWF